MNDIKHPNFLGALFFYYTFALAMKNQRVQICGCTGSAVDRFNNKHIKNFSHDTRRLRGVVGRSGVIR